MARRPLVSKEVAEAAARSGVDIDRALRDLLHLPAQPAEWTVKGVNFPEGTLFRCWWKDRPYWGEVKDGALVVDGKKFTTPSEATTVFTDPPVNGWRMWEARMPNTRNWVHIWQLRKDNKAFAND